MRQCFPEPNSFDKVIVAEGDVVRSKEGRRTFRFEYSGKGYFAKVHMGVGWSEIWKNLSQLRLPVVDASNEWKAVKLLESLNVDTVSIVGKGVRGVNPATRQSFVIMGELDERVELEDFMACPTNMAFNRQTRMIADLEVGLFLENKKETISNKH